MPTIRFDLEYPGVLDKPIIERFPNPDALVGDVRDIAIQQSLVADARARTLSGAEKSVGCSLSELVSLASEGRTVGGKWELDVASILCFDGRTFGEPSITATPVMGKPVLTSIGYELSGDGAVLLLRVFTTNPDGDATDAYFHWHAVVPLLTDLI